MKKIILFASGSGTNAENIIRFFNGAHPQVACIEKLYSNKSNAYALVRAEKLGIPTRIFSKKDWSESNIVRDELLKLCPDLIVLAGFLWLVPPAIVEAFPRRIVNIHPALLPKYGGHGMYGHHVHEAVKAAGERETGITIHYVNTDYDRGDIIFQTSCAVLPADTPDDIAAHVHELEQQYFPKVIAELIR